MENARTSRRHLPKSVRWTLFYLGLLLSPFTPGNDAVINQLPAAFLAALLAHGKAGGMYSTLYISFYLASNILGILLMLVNLPELQRRWNRLKQLRRNEPRKFWALIALDVATFVLFFLLGKVVAWAIGGFSS
jgi:hypothetical protein